MSDPKYWHSAELEAVAERLIDDGTADLEHLNFREIRYLLTTKEAPNSAEGCKQIASMRKLPALVSATAAGTSMRAHDPSDLNAEPRPIYVMCVNVIWWQHADERAREALVFHELSHIDYDGRIVPHDFADHAAVIRRYGQWNPGLEFVAGLLTQEGADGSN